MYYTRIDTALCPMVLIGDEAGLRRLHMESDEGNRKFELDENLVENKAVFLEAIRQINEYIAGERKIFTLKLNLIGTDFQKEVWKALCGIPYGETCSYKDIAKAIGNDKASRAVGMANNKNPIPLIVPCHRVVGANGQLRGYAFGLKIKEKILKIEERNK